MNIIDSLRQQYPILTHTSWQPLNVIKPHFNVDAYMQNSQNIVCATSDKLQKDFYALRCNEHEDLINHAISIENIGEKNKIFIFEKIKPNYYEHEVSSNDFIPVILPNGIDFTSGEWIANKDIIPININEGTQDDILSRTKAGIYIINDKERYLLERRNPLIWRQLKNMQTAYSVIKHMVNSNILTCLKLPCVENINNQNKTIEFLYKTKRTR